MSSMIVVTIVITVAVFIYKLVQLINDKEMRKRISETLARFSIFGSENNISYSSQEILHDSIIGFDGIQKKLIVLKEFGPSSYDWRIIDLNDVQNCTVRKSYRSIKAGELKGKSIEEYLEKINLRFEFVHNKKPFEISFYKHIDNKGVKVSELNRKAKAWQLIISKMLNNKKKKESKLIA